MPELIIFTDLDGTLLDHHTYSFEPARETLSRIQALGIPLIINSSKTRAEIIPFLDQLGVKQPFICENGAAVYFPSEHGWICEAFSMDRKLILQNLSKIKYNKEYHFSGFSDWSLKDIADKTGLDKSSAERAAQREFSEPLLWEDSDQAKLTFLEELADHQMTAAQGGRFLTITGITDKAHAMLWLADKLGRKAGTKLVALGDSPNDAEMLGAADIAVVIKSKRSSEIEVEGPARVIRTEAWGPEGWAESMNAILNDMTNTKAH
jgi:mannosyl-3-phosphoglycerate phosphatase